MDTGYDFITPEFLHLIFFQQKNLVIFPYTDVKHLRSLDIFTIGFDTVDIDSTSIHNLSEIIEYESNNSYSQQPTLYFILSPNEEGLQNLLSSRGVRCVVNARGNVESLANGDEFVFYNKKNKAFLNYSFDKHDLAFEQYLIQSSRTKEVLHDEILKVKSVASKIFAEINEANNSDNLPNLLSDFDQKYWEAILNFTRLYYDVEIPEFNKPKYSSKKKSLSPEKDFSAEYEIILKSNSAIGKSFVQLIHDYRSKKVNSANLGVDQLFYPQKLYNYLRNHHWKKGIPEEFVSDWIRVVNQDANSGEEMLVEFQIVLNRLDYPFSLPALTSSLQTRPRAKPAKEGTVVKPKKVIKKQISKFNSNSIPPIHNFQEFRQWMLKKIEQLEILGKNKLKGGID